jgi:UDPglucose--hexose-1-phosphate uridylyltransferase
LSELRQDPTTNDWIIFNRERARPPHEFIRSKVRKSLPARNGECPLCPGNEHRTPRAEAVYGSPDEWKIRVVLNKFPALTPDGDTSREERKLFRSFHGYGRHEVIIETPRHNGLIPLMEDGHVEEIFKAYRDRYHALKADPNIKAIIIFKNHGEGAGTTLVHPHTQVVASTVVPPFVRRRYEIATQHYDSTGRCLYCDLLGDELEASERIVMQTDHCIVLHPFSSHYPFETWIMPKAHKSSFGDISDDEIKGFSRVTKDVLLRLYTGLEDPDYNLIIHTAPVDDEHKSYFLWHIQIIPRLTHVAGFELGSGIYINSAVPEETAAFMRNIHLGGTRRVA